MIDITKNSDNNIRYQSPIRFLEQYNIDYRCGTIQSLTYLLLQVQRIYDQDNSTTIEIEGFIYFKEELIKEFQHPQFEKDLLHHITIWEKKGLLKFLEQGTIQLKEATQNWYELNENKEFTRFVSPYFIEPYQKVAHKWLNPPSFELAGRWLAFRSFMVTGDQQKALAPICDFMKENTDFFNQATFIDSRSPNLNAWRDQNWYIFINNMPDSLYEYKNNLILSILYFVEKTYRTDLETAFSIAFRLSKVENIDLQTAASIQEYYTPISEAYYKTVESERADNQENKTDNSPFGILKKVLSIVSFGATIISILSLTSKCS